MAEMSQLAVVGLFLAVCLLSFRDLSRPVEAQKATKNIPEPRLATFAGPSLKFLYW